MLVLSSTPFPATLPSALDGNCVIRPLLLHKEDASRAGLAAMRMRRSPRQQHIRSGTKLATFAFERLHDQGARDDYSSQVTRVVVKSIIESVGEPIEAPVWPSPRIAPHDTRLLARPYLRPFDFARGRYHGASRSGSSYRRCLPNDPGRCKNNAPQRHHAK